MLSISINEELKVLYMLQHTAIKIGYLHKIQKGQVKRCEKESVEMPKKGFSWEEDGAPSLE